ncbi:MAG TPA: lysylphosphatidylglycerol synthase domain-containing protein [Rhizomicrobium sp.]|nr:lysylphosphatidylglycerol synthase domain-containing protein [Rhizomicrobium sp.]
MRIGVIVAALSGLALLCYLLFYVGVGPVLAAASAVGWGGFALLCFYGVAMFALLCCAWFALIPSHAAPHLATFIWGRAVRDCAGEILPFSQVGGMVIGARAVMLRHVSGPLASASMIVDVTMEMIAQIAFVVTGLAILIVRVPGSPSSQTLAETLAIGIVVAAAGAMLFLLVQRRSLVLLERWAGRVLPQAAARAASIHRRLAEIHASPVRLGASLAIHFASWLATAFWSWIAIRLIGRHIAFPSVLAIEAILSAVRSTAFIVPGAIGVQEAAYAILVPVFGLPAPVGVAISLLRRARDITLGVPILLTWQLAEGGHALKASRDAERLVTDE